VIKIEPPTGEPLRRRVMATGGETTLPMAMLNANKRAITLNLKTARGRDLLKDMVRRADVLLENFSPGTLDDLGAGYDVLKDVNPRLIYATGTGFGITGPDRDNLAMDFTIQAASGIMSVTGQPDGPPTKAGPTLVDFMGGIHLYAAVMTALFQRDRTGQGQLVEVAMQETVYCSLAASYDYYFRTGNLPPRAGNRQAGLSSAPYNAFPTTDGHVAIHVVTEQHRVNLLTAMGREELKDDPRFRTNPDRTKNMEATEAVVGEWTRTMVRLIALFVVQTVLLPLGFLWLMWRLARAVAGNPSRADAYSAASTASSPASSASASKRAGAAPCTGAASGQGQPPNWVRR